MTTPTGESFPTRRGFLGAVAGAGSASLAGCSLFATGDDAPTSPVDGDQSRALAERFAPTLYFDSDEQWFPTDPRQYERERDGETVVDGFAALDEYTAAFDAADPPSPRVFYNVREYDDSPLVAVQFWYYSVFDQFTTNFHWHDWEVLHVFVDTDRGAPQLYVASSHSRSVPNNEFLDPEREEPVVLSELGSHSSALSLDEQCEQFQRLPLDGGLADITNRVLGGVEAVAAIPAAYGLPRDEGSRLPYVVPELDGAPLYEHGDLPAVEQSDLIPPELTIESFDGLSSPPTDLPARSSGTAFAHEQRSVDADVTYDLAPTTDLEHVSAFTGPQLSFRFAVPKFAEDAVASHITTASAPWSQPRYENPLADISDPNHRAALAERYDAVGDSAPINTVVTAVSSAVETDAAPENEGLETTDLPVETVALLESEAKAVPTFRGIAVVQDVPAGEHRLTVNGAGVAPHGEQITVADDDPTVAGVAGEIPLVAREHATKLRVDATETDADLTGLAVADDFAGRLYDAPMDGPDAVYVHRGGAYTTEVRDADDAIGAFRVTPGDEDSVTIDRPRTGKASLAAFTASISGETRVEVAALAENGGQDGGSGGTNGTGGDGSNAVRGLVRALEAVATAAQRAVDAAEAGSRSQSNRRLEAAQNGLSQVDARLDEARDALPAPLRRAIEHRLEQARLRTGQALAAEKL